MQIILDTNFLIDIARFGIDLDELGYLVESPRLATTDANMKELERIAGSKSKASRYAKAALRLVKRIDVIETGEKGDRAILSLANRNTIIATNDSELRKKLKKLGAKTIYLRSKKHLAIS